MKSYDEIKEILLRDYPKYFDILDLDMQIRQLIGVDPGRYKEVLDKNLENSMDVEKTWADNKALRDHNWLERNYNRHLNTYNDIKNKGGNNMYESIRTSLNEREEERSWSDDGKSLNIREMVARALEDNIHDKEFTDEEIDEIFGEVVDNDQYMEEIYMEIVNQTLEAAKKFRGE